MIGAMQQYTIWFDPQDTDDIRSPEEFDKLADAYGLCPLGRSCPPDDNTERWVASYNGTDHYMHILNTWVLGGWKHLIYRGKERLSLEDTFDWIIRRANARVQSTLLH